jgi:murein DD-endopeptidase MepM/ murein hydrolase activator NlpD
MANCSAPKKESNTKAEPIQEERFENEKIQLKERNSELGITDYKAFFKFKESFIASGFDFPVGAPDAKNYYNAQGFGENAHLGDDWNGTGGGNSDLGDPVYAVANGYVSEVYDAGRGWGNVVRIIHKIGGDDYVESVYAHLDTMLVEKGSGIKKGAQLGTIGNANGAYVAHLHLEIRHQVKMNLGGGYSTDTAGYLDPTQFINSHRQVMWRRVE